MGTNRTLLKADYLVIGAGAQGMTFTDELIHNTTNTKVIVIDNHSKPGGHWNDAYDFVTLHQPSAFYGDNSKPLEKDGSHFASSVEILAYCEDIMKDHLSTRRVKFFFQCEYIGDNTFHSLISEGLEYQVKVAKKTVDATYTAPTVPSTSEPKFNVSDDVNFQPINELSRIQTPWKRYVIIGGGKTGVDAVLYLLRKSVNPDIISWVIPNDFWLYNRESFNDIDKLATKFLKFSDSILISKDCNELYKNGEQLEFFLRLDTNVEPTRFKAGTVTHKELKRLRLVKNVIRQGRIGSIERNRIIFENGKEMTTDEDTLHVNCTASGCQEYTPRKIWNVNNIILQDILMVQPCYSAAVIAAIECLRPDDGENNNKLLNAIKHPQVPSDYIDCLITQNQNAEAIGKVLGVMWMRRKRLSVLYHLSRIDFLKFWMWNIFNKANLDVPLKNIQKKLIKNADI